MNLSPQEIDAIASAVVARLLPRLSPSAPSYGPLPHKLTVEEFAWCVHRSAYTVREWRRTNRAFRKHCQGERPIMIHPAALELYGVDSGLAAARLQQFPGRECTTDTRVSGALNPGVH